MTETLTLISNILFIAFYLSAPIIITGLGGLFSERSGVVNVALDGCMQVGAFTGVVVLLKLVDAGYIEAAKYWAVLAAIVSGTIFMSLHAFASINMKADQTISGTALNILAAGLTIYLCSVMYDAKSTPTYSTAHIFGTVSIPLLKDIPILGKFFFTNNYPYIYVAVILTFVTWFIVYKTPFGLRLRSCGEFPQASASMGIDVMKTKWAGVLISGALSGLGGIALVFSAQTFFNGSSIHSMGFVAIATLIFGKWNPWGVLGAGILFGFSQALVYYVNVIPFLQLFPSEFLSAFPYVLTIIVIIFNGKQIGPKASGEIYDPSKR